MEQFTRMFHEFSIENSVLTAALTNTFILFFSGLLITFPLSFLLCYFLYKKILLYRVFRVIFYLPKQEDFIDEAEIVYIAMLDLCADGGEYDYDKVIDAVSLYSKVSVDLRLACVDKVTSIYDGAVAQLLNDADGLDDTEVVVGLIQAGKGAPRECGNSLNQLLGETFAWLTAILF